MAMKNAKNRPKTRNAPKKNFQAQIYFLICFQGKQNTHNFNSPQYMELFDTKNNCFGGWIPHQRTLFFSLSKNITTSLSLLQPKRDRKMSKIKFSIKIEFCKIQGTVLLLAKNNRDSNEFVK